MRPRPVAPAPAAPRKADDAQVDRSRKHIVPEHEVSAISPLTWRGPGIGRLALLVRVCQVQAAGAGRRHKRRRRRSPPKNAHLYGAGQGSGRPVAWSWPPLPGGGRPDANGGRVALASVSHEEGCSCYPGGVTADLGGDQECRPCRRRGPSPAWPPNLVWWWSRPTCQGRAGCRGCPPPMP